MHGDCAASSGSAPTFVDNMFGLVDTLSSFGVVNNSWVCILKQFRFMDQLNDQVSDFLEQVVVAESMIIQCANPLDPEITDWEDNYKKFEARFSNMLQRFDDLRAAMPRALHEVDD